MKQQSNTDYAKFWIKQKYNINTHRPIAMQRMKIDAAAIRVKYGICQ